MSPVSPVLHTEAEVSIGLKTSIVKTYLCKEVYPQCASLTRGNNPSTKYLTKIKEFKTIIKSDIRFIKKKLRTINKNF